MGQHAQLEIDNKKFSFGYNFNSLCDAEEVAQCNLLDAVAKIAGGGAVTAVQLRGLVYAMIVPEGGFPRKQEDLLAFVGTLIRIDTIGALLLTIGHACTLAISEEAGSRYLEDTESDRKQAMEVIGLASDQPADRPTPVEPSASA